MQLSSFQANLPFLLSQFDPFLQNHLLSASDLVVRVLISQYLKLTSLPPPCQTTLRATTTPLLETPETSPSTEPTPTLQKATETLPSSHVEAFSPTPWRGETILEM